MFRALLWKEWRELWMLPAAALPLAAMSFFLAKPHGPRITADIWEIAFSSWLLLAVLYIPTHLYTRDKELDTSVFINSMPLDRFRLWWLKLFVGLTVLASIVLVLYGATTILCGLYEQAGPFSLTRSNIIAVSIGFSLFVWGLSTLLSTLFRKQRNALVVCSLCLVALWMIWSLLSRQFSPIDPIGGFFSKNPYYLAVGFATISFPLLLASLLHFARDNLWNQRWATFALAYGASVVLLVTPAAAGVLHMVGGLEEALKPKAKAGNIRLKDSSEDGSRLLLDERGNDCLLSVDLSQRKVHLITTDSLHLAHLNENRNIISYAEWHEWYAAPWYLDSSDIIFSDFNGTNKKNPFKNDLTFSYPTMAWSLDGSYLGIVDYGAEYRGIHSFTAITDADGHLLWKRENPLLDDSWFWPIGWDYKLRFYYRKGISKENPSTESVWRVSIDSPEPKRLSLDMVDDYSYYYYTMSPNGKWMAVGKSPEDVYSDELWIYDVSTDQASLLSKEMYSYEYEWSADGNRLACVEATGEHKDGALDEPLPTRLVIYDLASGESMSISLGVYTLEDTPLLLSWSLSGEHMLFRSGRKKYITSKAVYTFLSFSLRSQEFIEIPEKVCYWQTLRWLPEERIMWLDNNRIVATHFDGTNPQEVFRIENGKFYLYGKEQS